MLSRISADAHALVGDQYELLNGTILPALEREGIRFLRRGEWSDAQDAWITRYFTEQLLPDRELRSGSTRSIRSRRY